MPREPQRMRKQGAFPIVGIGASAGGLEALELFLRHVPEASGMAFVIVQHLDPTHKGIMAELLQRATRMPVVQVRDRKKVAPDRVYVIPPNKDMSILHGVLHLLEPAAPRGLRLPIDFFFRSLAEDRQERSIGVILSGMGSDGTLGLRAIKEKAGVVFVQEPASAKFDGMPRSAIDAGLADVVAPAEELPGRILAYLQHVPLVIQPDPARESKTQSALEKVVILLRAQTGHDFLPLQEEHRLPPDRAAHGHPPDRQDRHLCPVPAGEPPGGGAALQGAADRRDQLLPRPGGLGAAEGGGHPGPVGGSSEGGVLRAWVPGCSTGEEAYSLAIVFKEALERVKPAGNFTLQIFATDLDRDAIDKARAGRLSGQHRRRRVARAPAPLLRPGRARLPGGQGDPRDGDLRAAEPHHGSALHQARPPESAATC